MNKRLINILKKAHSVHLAMIDAYCQKIHVDISCTILTNIDMANNHFIIEQRKYMQQLEQRTDGCSNTLTSVQKDNLIVEPGNIAAAMRGREPVVLGWTRDKHGNVVDRHPVSVANAVTSAKRDNTQNYVVEPSIIQRGHGFNPGGEFCKTTPTITGSTWHFNNLLKDEYKIRKLTERECFRLMGVADADSDKIRQVVSKTQCYKLAGNSIVVDVLVAIFNQLFSENKTTDKQLKLF